MAGLNQTNGQLDLDVPLAHARPSGLPPSVLDDEEFSPLASSLVVPSTNLRYYPSPTFTSSHKRLLRSENCASRSSSTHFTTLACICWKYERTEHTDLQIRDKITPDISFRYTYVAVRRH